MIKTLKNIASAIAIIALIAGGIWLFLWAKKMQRVADESMRTAISMREHPVEVVSVVRTELGSIYPYIDSVIKLAGLNVRHVEKITNIYHEYKWDTVPAIIIADSGKQLLRLPMKEACFSAEGLLDFSETSVKLTDEDITRLKFHLTDVVVTDTTTTVYYFNRKIKKIFFLRLRIGRKQYYSETYSSCKAQTQTESINLIKR